MYQIKVLFHLYQSNGPWKRTDLWKDSTILTKKY